MLKNLRLLVPVGLICAAGTVASAEVRLVVRNESGRPWRLRCLQDMPTFTLHRIAAGSVSSASTTPRVTQELLVGAKERIELQWTDASVPSQTVRFALLPEGRTEMDGTVLAFTWDWKSEGRGTAQMIYPQETDLLRHAQRREAAGARGNDCLIRWATFTDPESRTGSGAGTVSLMAARLPMGVAGKETAGDGCGVPALSQAPKSLSPSRPAAAGAGAGAGAGLPTGPALIEARTLMRNDLAYKARAAALAVPVSQAARAAEESKSTRLRVRRAELRNHSGRSFQAEVTGVVDGSRFRQAHADGHGAGDLQAGVPVPDGSNTTLDLATTSPQRPSVLVTATSPGQTDQYVWRPFGATPDRDGKQPSDLRRLDSAGDRPDATSQAQVRKGEAGALVIETFDAKAEADLSDDFARLALRVPDAAQPYAAHPYAAPHRPAGAGRLDATVRTWGCGLVDGDSVTEQDIDDYLDLEAVAAGGDRADAAVARFLDNRLDRHPRFSLRLSQLGQQLAWAMEKAGIEDPADAETADIHKQPGIIRSDRQYKEAGEPLRRELLDRQAEMRLDGLAPGDEKPLCQQLEASYRAWMVRKLHATWSQLLADAAQPVKALPSAGAGAGPGAGSGSSSTS